MRISQRLGLLLAALLCMQTADLNAAYTAPRSFLMPKLTAEIGSKQYRVAGPDDSAVFQHAIDDVHAAGGGRVVVPAGVYHVMNIELKSNVHVIFKRGVILHPAANGDVNLFKLGMTDAIENVSLLGMEDRKVRCYES